MTATDRRIVYMRVADIPEADRNAKRHDLDLLDQSFGRWGFIEPCVVDERTGRLVSGHGRREQLAAMERNGTAPPDGVKVRRDGWYAPVVRGWASADDDEAEAVGVALNRTGERGGWDDQTLYDILSSQDDFTGIGYSPEDLAGLLESLGEEEPPPDLGADLDEVPDPPAVPKTKTGDLWVMGTHRLFCGDATDPTATRTVMAGDKANMVWTDPPYGVPSWEAVTNFDRSTGKLKGARRLVMMI